MDFLQLGGAADTGILSLGFKTNLVLALDRKGYTEVTDQPPIISFLFISI